jgi:L-lactate dehydrogenase complex protein LldG
MNSRDKILARLNKWPVDKLQPFPRSGDADIFLDYPGPGGSLLDIFTRQLTQLQGELRIAGSRKQAADYLHQFLKEFSRPSTLLHPSALLSEIISQNSGLKSWIDDTYQLNGDSISFAGYDCGITTADYLIARSGSIILTSLSAGGRRLSVLPPVHIVIAEERQIVPSLEEAFNLLKGKSVEWSYAVVITGPSRTSDIEKQLVLGAHGPKRLVVIILRS